MNQVQRPGPKKQKINTKDEFELCYLRHQYLRRSTYNPSEEELRPYLPIIQNQARKTLLVNLSLFGAVGMDIDDIVNIGLVHAVSFLNLFTVEKQPAKMEKFIDNHIRHKGRHPDFFDVCDKNKANFTCFMKQRYEDLVRICKQKSRNIEGVHSEDFVAFCGKKPPKCITRLLKEYTRLGFKKLDPAVFRTIRKRARPNNQEFFEFKGDWYIVVRTERVKLMLENLITSSINPFNAAHTASPEDRYSEWIEEKNFQDNRDKYEGMSDEDKAKLIRNFVRKNQDNQRFEEELRTAKRLLRGMGSV